MDREIMLYMYGLVLALVIIGIMVMVIFIRKRKNVAEGYSVNFPGAATVFLSKKQQSPKNGQIMSAQKCNISPQKLYEGCIQAAITHAITVGMYPEFNYEHSWDGINYNMNNGEGCRATITFHEKYIIAVFQDVHNIDDNKNAMDYFDGAPDDLIQIAQKEALQYVLDDVNGVTKPVITAAFWGTWEQLYSTQSYDEIMKNSDYIITNHLLSFDDALAEWNEYYELDDRQSNLSRDLFNKKMASHGKKIEITDDEIQALYGDIDECFTSLGELGIFKSN